MRRFLHNLNREKINGFFNPLVAVLVAFAVSGLMVMISGQDPIEAYLAIIKGAFGSATSFRNTLRYTFPILLLALSFCLCNKCGYFNIGQEGQMYASALAICWIQRLFGELPIPILILLMLAGAMLAGGIISLIPAALKFILGINEVVVAILLNYILVSLSNYMLLYSGIANPKSSVAKSITIVPQIPLPVILAASVIILLIYALVLKNTIPGFRLRICGHNPIFGQAMGLHTAKQMLIVAMFGGALSGLAASCEIMGIYHEMYNAYADGMGFMGMPAALIGKSNAAGMLLGSLMLGALQGGAVNLSIATDTPAELVLVVRGFVMLFATINLMQYFKGKSRQGKNERRVEKKKTPQPSKINVKAAEKESVDEGSAE